jgi:predicted XRE-type DNA-binding protein
MKKDESELAQEKQIINQEVRQSSVWLSVNKLVKTDIEDFTLCAIVTVIFRLCKPVKSVTNICSYDL